MPATNGFRPRAYLSQLGMPSPAGSAVGAALDIGGEVGAEAYFPICPRIGQAIARRWMHARFRLPMEALKNARRQRDPLWTPKLPSLLTNCGKGGV